MNFEPEYAPGLPPPQPLRFLDLNSPSALTALRLVLPGLTAVTAHFSRLGWLGEGDGQVIRYSFEFLESPGPGWAGGEG